MRLDAGPPRPPNAMLRDPGAWTVVGLAETRDVVPVDASANGWRSLGLHGSQTTLTPTYQDAGP